ncbi:hypothetical protein, partial [Citrobacter koseri]|uniref:hypothetical protein n=1 Tax=Citrobacter koseri TaxID=545 RepID=UPI0023AE98DD
MSAMTCFSTAALADVTPHSNTDSVDFSTEMTVQGKQCPLTVAKAGDVSFKFTYNQDDEQDGTYGLMQVVNASSIITIATTDGCTVPKIHLTANTPTNLISVARGTAGIATRNGGFVPFVAQLANVTFSNGAETRTATNYDGSLRSNLLPAPPQTLTFGSSNTDTQIAGHNVVGISGFTGGWITVDGAPNDIPPNDSYAVRNGLADIKSLNPINPIKKSSLPDLLVAMSPDHEPATGSPDSDFMATSESITITAMVGTTIYGLTDMLPDPSAVWDSESLSSTVTYTLTTI